MTIKIKININFSIRKLLFVMNKFIGKKYLLISISLLKIISKKTHLLNLVVKFIIGEEINK